MIVFDDANSELTSLTACSSDDFSEIEVDDQDSIDALLAEFGF